MLKGFEKNIAVHLALILSAASGLIYEVVATNILFSYFVRSSYSIATVLSVFLFGLGLGSFLVHVNSKRIEDKRTFFGLLQFVLAVYGLCVLARAAEIVPSLGILGLFFSSFVILLFPTLILGAVFPLAGSIVFESSQDKNLDVSGLIYSVDLVGAIAGTVAAGFFLIPFFGNAFTILFAVLVNFTSAVAMFRGWKKYVAVLGAAFVVLLLLGFDSSDVRGVVFSKPSPFGEIVVKDQTLFIDNREQCSLHYPERATERTIVEYSLKPFGTRELDVVNVGLGCGLTLKEILASVSGDVDVIEINPVVVDADGVLSNVLDDERVNLFVDDGVHYLKNTGRRYDSVIVDIENPAVIHSSDLYTVESFEAVSAVLTEDGTFGLWTCYCASEEYYDALYHTLREVFPFVYKLGGYTFVASKMQLEYEKYRPVYDKVINTLDKKILSKIYFDQCKWWAESDGGHVIGDL
jgi:predicted membrane-bound spermidine synthase